MDHGQPGAGVVTGLTHVAVVGAGIGGLAAALALSRVAGQVTLLERREHPAEVGAALALQANGLAVLDELGVRSAVEQIGSRIDRMWIRNAAGTPLLTAVVPDFGDGLDHALAVRRTELHQLLLDAVLAEGSIETRFGCTLVQAEPTGELVVHTGSDGSGPDGTALLRFDLVVGADGANSAVRSTGGFPARISTGSRYVRAIVDAPADAGFEEYWTPLGSFGHAAIGPAGTPTYFWAAAHAPQVADAVSNRDLDTFTDAWERVLPSAGRLLRKVATFDELLLNTVRRVDCRRWRSGRLVLLGDAAHAMAPNLGQGANSALVDAMVLAASLRTEESVPVALQRYDRRRRPVVRRVQNIAGLLESLCNLRHRSATRMRDAVLTTLARSSRLSATAMRRALEDDIRTVRTS